MAEDKNEPREINWRQLLPWTAIFQGFRIALDMNKLLLAALGILAMAIVWWVLAVIFYSSAKPTWPSSYLASNSNPMEAWAQFKKDREAWNLLHEAAGKSDSTERVEPEDLADSPTELEIINTALREGPKPDVKLPEDVLAKIRILRDPPLKPSGRMRTFPWFEHRGSNPYLLVTGRAGAITEQGTQRLVPWERGHFAEWLTTEQAPVLLEPLIKMLRPVIYFFSPRAGALSRFYFLLAMLATVAIWGIIGGAITRIAAVQVARQEKIGAREALTFTFKRYLSLTSAPIFPLILVAVVVVAMILFGILMLVPILGEVVGGLLWFLMLAAGLGMIVILIGLVGWPLMAATISAEGTDSWEAVSRSYSYVFGAPWHYIFYSIIALAYGAVLIFFVGFVGSATVYFAKWGVNRIQPQSRDVSYLFVWAPTSFEWRDLLLMGYKVEGEDVWKNGRPTDAYAKLMNDKPVTNEENKWQQMKGYNYVGTFIVSVWLYLFFLMILGFGYSYFWSASTIIYLLMRRKVDDTEMDEVYLEDEEPEGPYSAGPTFTPQPAATPAPAGVTMVEAPTLRTPGKEEATASPAATPPPATGDGNPAAGGGTPS